MGDSDWLRDVAPGRRAAFGLLRRTSLALHFAGHMLEQLAAAVLTAEDVKAARDDEWTTFNRGVDAVDWGLFPWEQTVYDRCIGDRDRVLVVGCGSGRDLVALAKRGLEVSGLEPVPQLAAEARSHVARHGLSASITVGEIEDAELTRDFDVYVFSYFCYTYIRSIEARTRALRRIRQHLAPGGRVLISSPPPRRVCRFHTSLPRLVNRLAHCGWRTEPGDVFVFASRERLDYAHTFAPGELDREAASAGFRVARYDLDFYELRAAG